MDDLHQAAFDGSVEHTIALLSQGSTDIDGLDREDVTPLMYAVMRGHAAVARVLISRGANVSKVSKKLGFAPLHWSAYEGHVIFTEALIKAGADLEVTRFAGGPTPLHMASDNGHWEVMRILIEAGADIDSRCANQDSRTPLLIAAEEGHVKAVRGLLRANANPLLGLVGQGATFLPLDVAASKGHLEVVNEMIQHVGIGGCGGASGGADALRCAVIANHVGIMSILTDAGVVDTGEALVGAAQLGNETAVKFLLQQQQQQQQGVGRSTGGVAYVDTPDAQGTTPIVGSVIFFRSRRVLRLLVDAGADTTSAVSVTRDPGGEVDYSFTPLALVNQYLNNKRVGGQEATEQERNTLKAARRLLLQVEAVHAVSWLWHGDAPLASDAAADGASRTTTPSAPLALMMPILRRRAARRGVLLAALSRQSSKP